MRIRGSIRHSLRAYLVWKVVAAAVGYGAIAIGELWQMLQPHPVVLKSSVNKYDRFALANFRVGNLGPVGRDALYVVCMGNGNLDQNTRRCGEINEERNIAVSLRLYFRRFSDLGNSMQSQVRSSDRMLFDVLRIGSS